MHKKQVHKVLKRLIRQEIFSQEVLKIKKQK